MAAAFIFTGSKVIRYVNADDGQSVAVTDIDYDKMTLTISGNNDTAYYFSDSNTQPTYSKTVCFYMVQY